MLNGEKVGNRKRVYNMNLTTALLSADLTQAEPSIGLVVLMGVGIVFIGLICLIMVCKITSFFCALGNKKATEEAPKAVAPAPVAAEPIADRKQFIAAVSAVIAEELGTDVSAIRILSVKKI